MKSPPGRASWHAPSPGGSYAGCKALLADAGLPGLRTPRRARAGGQSHPGLSVRDDGPVLAWVPEPVVLSGDLQDADPVLDVGVAAGPGALNEAVEQTKATCLFADSFIRHEFAARPEDLRMITVDGDSMEPLLSSGDRILIDVNRQVPVPPGIFVIWDGMGLVAKQIERMPGSEPPKVVIKSANPEYDSYERLADEIRIVGCAVRASRRL